jgi:hypothetical protein
VGKGGAVTAVDALTLPHMAHGTATCTAQNGLRVRAAPIAGAVLGSLAWGEVVDVWSVVNGWAIVQTAAGLTGWASMTYLKVQGELVA